MPPHAPCNALQHAAPFRQNPFMPPQRLRATLPVHPEHYVNPAQNRLAAGALPASLLHEPA